MESGVTMCPWAVNRPGNRPRPREEARWLASALGCDVSDSSAMVACLRNKDVRDIMEKTTEVMVRIRA